MRGESNGKVAFIKVKHILWGPSPGAIWIIVEALDLTLIEMEAIGLF